jgi:hypothetical protein
MKPLRIYVAGPITLGDTLAHIGNGIAVCNILLDEALVPFCPHLSAFLHMARPRSYEEWVRYDFHWLRLCHAVLRLPGESRGADREVDEALRLGIIVFGNIETLLGWARAQSQLAPDIRGSPGSAPNGTEPDQGRVRTTAAGRSHKGPDR